MSHYLAGKSIIVVGGGIAGCSFTIALHRLWPSNIALPRVRVFERDEAEERIGREGYSLSLRDDSRSGGVQALDRMGLYDQTLSSSITNDKQGGSFCIWDKHWNPIFTIPVKASGPKGLRPMRIRRNALQRVLTERMVEIGCSVSWEKECASVEQSADKVKIRFSDGSEEIGDLLIAADGASSRVLASLRQDQILNFAGVICIGGVSRFESAEAVPKPVDRDWGPVLSGTGIGLFASPVDETSALWSLSYCAESPRERMRRPLTEEQVESVMKEARMLAVGLPKPLATLLDAADSSTLTVFNAMDRLAFPHNASDARHGNVVFIGDSNHAVR